MAKQGLNHFGLAGDRVEVGLGNMPIFRNLRHTFAQIIFSQSL